MKRLAPWQRNMIALAHGVILKPSGQMKWIANIVVEAPTPESSTDYGLFPIEADSEGDAARSAAYTIAKELYGEHASVGFMQSDGENFFRASIGTYVGGGIIQGTSLSILIREYQGVQ
jgi:hypothetical protein